MSKQKSITIENIYENLQQADLDLANKNLDLVRSVVRMSHTLLAMAVYGFDDELGELKNEAERLIAQPRGCQMPTDCGCLPEAMRSSAGTYQARVGWNYWQA